MANGDIFNMIDNYVYLYHVDKFLVIPTYPESIQDAEQVNFSSTTPLARSAPIYSFTSSGPRSFAVSLKLHRDIMWQVNYGVSNIPADGINDDYVDLFIKYMQAAALPNYNASQRLVDPPLIAVRFGNDIFCKGVVSGNVGITYEPPIIEGDRYATVTVGFGIQEVDPWDAQTVLQAGSYRGGLNLSLERNMYSNGSTARTMTRM